MTSRRPRQSRWWYVVGAVAIAILGLVSTRMGTTEFDDKTASDLRALLGALAAISLLALALQLVLVGVLADPRRRDRILRPPSVVPTIAAAALTGLLAAAATVVFVDSTASFEARAALSIGIAVAAITVSIPSRSVLLGEERWRELALIGVVASAVRLVITMVGADSGQLTTILLGLALSETVGAAAAIFVTRRAERIATWPPAAGRHIRIGSAAALGLMVVIVVSSLSVERLLGDEVERYNQSAAIARLSFVLIFTVAFVFLPAIAREPIGSVLLRRSFHTALLLTSITAVVAGGSIAIFPDLYVDVLDVTIESTTPIRLLAIAFSLFGVAAVSLMQYIVHGSRFGLVSWPVGGIVVVGQVIASSAVGLAWFVLAAAVVLVVIASLPAVVRVQPVLHPEVVDHAGEAAASTDDVTVVVPSYNPGPAVLDTVRQIMSSFEAAGTPVRMIVVSDGSTDGSDDELDRTATANLTHIRHDVNRGKGAALRTGFAAAETPLVAFVDADGDLPPTSIVEMVRIQQETGADIVFGSKRHGESTVSVPMIRRITSRVYEVMIRRMFQLDISDTQTGIKLYTKPVLDATLPVLEETGFALDLELFVAARASGFNHFVEVPVSITRQGGSTISTRSAATMIGHTMQIFWRAKVTLQYLRAAAAAPPSSTSELAPRAS